MAKKKLSLKPVEATLKKIVTKLEKESTTLTGKKKTTIDGEITAIKTLIKQVPTGCKKYNVG